MNSSELFSNISGIALKHWLKIKGYKHTFSTNEQLFEFIDHNVSEKQLSLDLLYELACDLEESSSKLVHLYKVPHFNWNNRIDILKSYSNFGKRLLSRQGKNSKESRMKYFINNQHSNLRAKYTEMQTQASIDLATMKPLLEDQLKLIVILLEKIREKNILSIRYDSPANIHEHRVMKRPSKEAYFGFYKMKAEEIFQLTNKPPVPYHLDITINYLCENPKVFRMPNQTVRSSFNSMIRIDAPSNKADVRNDPAFKGASSADGDSWVEQSITGYFLPSSDGNLSREIWVKIYRNGNLVFRRDCLEEEINYVISQVTKA